MDGTIIEKTTMENPAGDGNPMSKEGLRKEILARRSALSEAETREMSDRVLARVRALPAWAGAREVLTYMPVRGEVDVAGLLPELWARGTRVLLPRCRPGERGVMDLACATCLEDLAPGAYGIPEPDPASCPLVPDAAPDLVLVPGVAFDRRGFRLGFGAGFYDRFLAAGRAPSGGGRPPLLVGPCYGFQLCEALPVDPWDVPVHVVVTEDSTLWI